MEFENLLMRIILRYCDEHKISGMTAEESWQLAKRIAIVAKQKSRKEIQDSL